ncbi:hypothetical protein D4764_05G0000960 [Takifugu flavidus]|uniref:Uncharacterized protein n=1 Tax=Takifugu flavidus TaxID=433684 RepID=A0A5C6MY71_9TELE|nr:hypothetical protein D4764_05G0000960 [Takifugu flavidus]
MKQIDAGVSYVRTPLIDQLRTRVQAVEDLLEDEDEDFDKDDKDPKADPWEDSGGSNRVLEDMLASWHFEGIRAMVPTQSHRVPGARRGVGQSEEGTSRWGTMGCGRESRPAEDKSNASFITRCHARSGKDGGRGAQAQGSKGEARWGGTQKAGGGSGRPAFSGRGAKQSDGVQKLWSWDCVDPTLMEGPGGRWVKMIKQPPSNQTH